MNVRLPLLLCLFAIPVLAQENKGSKVDFQKDIWPILEKRCIECHSAAHTTADGKTKKPKGGIVLDSKDGITTSKNKSGKVFASWTLAAEYGFTDEDGSRPDWGAHFEKEFGGRYRTFDDELYAAFAGPGEVVFGDWP